MENIVIYGSGGFAREVIHLIDHINEVKTEWRILGYLDDDTDNHGKVINELPVLGGAEWLDGKEIVHVALGIGSPKVKKAIVTKLKKFPNVVYPNLIHPSVKFSRFNTIGRR